MSRYYTEAEMVRLAQMDSARAKDLKDLEEKLEQVFDDAYCTEKAKLRRIPEAVAFYEKYKTKIYVQDSPIQDKIKRVHNAMFRKKIVFDARETAAQEDHDYSRLHGL